jgi:hypothetical protein
MATKVNSKPMCAVTIGYHEYLMPASVGMKVVELLQSAFEAEHIWDDVRIYTVGSPVNVEFRSVRPDQIRVPAPVKPLMLEHK